MMTMFMRFGAHLDTSNICTGDDPLHWSIYWASDEMRWSESREIRDDLWFRGSNIALLSMICIGTFALEFYLYKLYPPFFFSRFQFFLFITTTLHEFRFVSNHHQLLRLCITLFRLVIKNIASLHHHLFSKIPSQRTSNVKNVPMCLDRYVQLRFAHTFSPPWVGDPDMHHGTCLTHVPWNMPESLINGFLWKRWRGKRSRHSRYMHNPQFYVSIVKNPMSWHHFVALVARKQ